MDAQPVVFVIDDDPAIRKSLRWLIESVGLEVRPYASAREFLDVYDPDVAGCIVLDVRMPGMSGLELQEKLQAQNSELPVIAVTAFGDIPSAVRALKAGAIDFLEKPVVDQVLLDTIQRAIAKDLENRRGREEKSTIVRRIQMLTDREREVLDLVADGLSSRTIAERWGVAGKTIESHRASIMRKMQAKNIAELVRMSLLVRE